ncbi:MAG: DUF937 domain-containing protein [Comamonas sp.]|nr:DUF937 domain-containing protein [Comamonas sp.]
MNNNPSSMAADLLAQLQGAPIEQMSSQLGIGSEQVSSAIGQALPVLLGALGQNAAQPQGAADLLGALLKDHSPASSASAAPAQGLGGLLGAVLGGVASSAASGAGGNSQNGAAILGHILGGARGQVESQLGQNTGIGDKMGPLLAMLAPLVMSFLSQRIQGSGMGAPELGQMLGAERNQAQQQGGLAGNLLTSLLDQNGDGKLDASDLLKFGASLLGGRR